MTKNRMSIEFSALSKNEAFARTVVAAFVMQLDPTINEINEIKTAVSEAVTNAIIHGYENDPTKNVMLNAEIDVMESRIIIEIFDNGIGIPNITEATEPLFTSKPELERSGMGFTIMENFMDLMHVESEIGIGTKVRIEKYLVKENTYV